MSVQLREFYAAHVEWLGTRKKLAGQQQKHFYRWMCAVHPDLYKSYHHEPALFYAQCREVQRGPRLPLQHGIGQAVLERHAEALVAHYLKQGEQEKFSEFLDRIKARCPNEHALKRLLGLPDA